MPSLIPSFEQNSQEVKNGIYKINRGSGFLVSRNLVLTALHCVNTDKNNVQLGTTVSAIGSDHVLTTGYVVKFDINNDLALIKLDHCTESQYKIFKIAAYDRPSNTGVVVAYGYPGVNVQDGQANLSYDYFKFAKTGLPLFEDWYQPIREQDVFVNLPGFSGGPILDEHNFIVGVSSHVGSNDGRGLLVSPSLVAIKDFLSQKTERIEELHISGKKYYIQNYCASDEITYENLSEKKPIMYSDLQEYMDGFLRISLQLVDKKLIINDFTPCSYNQKTISKGVVEVIAKKILQDETISIKSDNEGYFAEVETLNTSIVGINLLSQGVCFTINGKWAKSKIIDPLRQINLYSYMYGFKDEYIANFDYIRDYAQDELTPVNAMQAILNSQDIPYGTAWQ